MKVAAWVREEAPGSAKDEERMTRKKKKGVTGIYWCWLMSVRTQVFLNMKDHAYYIARKKQWRVHVRGGRYVIGTYILARAWKGSGKSEAFGGFSPLTVYGAGFLRRLWKSMLLCGLNQNEHVLMGCCHMNIIFSAWFLQARTSPDIRSNQAIGWKRTMCNL